MWRWIKEFHCGIVFPVGLVMEQYAFLEEMELDDVRPIKNLLDAGGSIAGPYEFPTGKWDAVATCPRYLRNEDPNVGLFDVREERDLHRGAYLVTHSQVKYPQQKGADRELFYFSKPGGGLELRSPLDFQLCFLGNTTTLEASC